MVEGRDCGRLREIVRDCGRFWEIVVYITWYFSMAERGECFPEMLTAIGIVPTRRNGRKRWSGPHKQNKPNVKGISGQTGAAQTTVCDHFVGSGRALYVGASPGSIIHAPPSKKYMVSAPLINNCISYDLRSVSKFFCTEIAGVTNNPCRRSDRQYLNSGACSPTGERSPTARDRPEPTKWSKYNLCAARL